VAGPRTSTHDPHEFAESQPSAFDSPDLKGPPEGPFDQARSDADALVEMSRMASYLHAIFTSHEGSKALEYLREQCFDSPNAPLWDGEYDATPQQIQHFTGRQWVSRHIQQMIAFHENQLRDRE
jgi:hypothetical protein